MKILTLLRHAKSSWGSPALDDFDRPLNKRGRAGAQAIGKEMRNLGLGFDTILASPAARVVETLACAAEGYEVPLRPTYEPLVYLASAATLLALVHQANDAIDRLLLVGHNPGLERLAMLLIGEDDNGLRAELAIKYPTGTLAEIMLPAKSWRDVAAGSGTLNRFIRPRDVDPNLGPDQADD